MPTEKETILITGSSGLIGTAVCNRLAALFKIAGFDRDGPPHPPPSAECVCVDLTSDTSVQRAFERVQAGYGSHIASVIHLAAYYDFSGEPSDKYETITVQGTERLLRGLQKFNVDQFIFSSTMLVHAPCQPNQKINEEWPLDPKWDYPKSKVKTENLIRQKHGNIPIALLRIAGVYNDYCHSIPIAHQIQRIYENEITSKVFPGDTSHGQSFIHLDDLVDAIARVVEHRHDLPLETTLLLGEPETFSYDTLQRELGHLIHDKEWETEEIPKTFAKTGAWLEDHLHLRNAFIKPWMIDLADDHYALDISRAQRLLGWNPQHSLLETLPKMVEALKTDPAKWYKENKLEPPRHFPKIHEPLTAAAR